MSQITEPRDTGGHTTESDELDAWECNDCCGSGRRTEWHSVTHQLGTDRMEFWVECPTCEGSGYCGPDAARAGSAS